MLSFLNFFAQRLKGFLKEISINNHKISINEIIAQSVKRTQPNQFRETRHRFEPSSCSVLFTSNAHIVLFVRSVILVFLADHGYQYSEQNYQLLNDNWSNILTLVMRKYFIITHISLQEIFYCTGKVCYLGSFALISSLDQ